MHVLEREKSDPKEQRLATAGQCFDLIFSRPCFLLRSKGNLFDRQFLHRPVTNTNWRINKMLT